ncbi:hypothetical protein RRG08_065480 [Elysia crispata]|uniref:Uncharacterized protein n=1 Tax=Elysia crispata TaxID=231223 RepID=A0AAE1AQB4_9GAST|nr:hypothetical protein RRG08_065480 [Elysia crispata]
MSKLTLTTFESFRKAALDMYRGLWRLYKRIEICRVSRYVSRSAESLESLDTYRDLQSLYNVYRDLQSLYLRIEVCGGSRYVSRSAESLDMYRDLQSL